MLDKKGRGERIKYAIRKKLSDYSFIEWCEVWEFTPEEVTRFLELGAKVFDEESTEK